MTSDSGPNRAFLLRFASCAIGPRHRAAEKSRNLRLAGKLREILRRGELRLVTHRVHHAQKTQRLIRGGAKLMPCQRRHGDEVTHLDRAYVLADQAMAAPPQYQHGMHVLVPLERGKA